MRTERIRNKRELLAVWKREADRFRRLYRALPETKLRQKVPTSNCGHTYGQHIPCMLVWMETALAFFRARLKKKPQPFRDYRVPMLEFTNRELARCKGVPASKIWKRLDAVEKEFMEVVRALDNRRLFTNEAHAWDHFVWSTFGHYDEHSTELEWDHAGRRSLAPDKTWRKPRKTTMKKRPAIKVRAVDFVMYNVANMRRSKAFYRTVLGLRRGHEYSGFWTEFNTKPATVALCAPGKRSRWWGAACVALAVPDVQKAVDALRKRGVKILMDCVETNVCYMAFIADPDGNRICLHQRKDGTAG